MNLKLKIIVIFLLLIIIYKLHTKIENRIVNYQNNNRNILSKEDIIKGKNVAKNNRINICFIIRDCERQVKNNMKYLERIGSIFKDYRIIIFENDSKDNSRNIIKNFCRKNNKINLIECDTQDCKLSFKKSYEYGQFSRSRISKMGFYRNKYLEVAKKTNFEFTMVIDIDLDLSQIDINGIYYCLSKQERWNGIFMNGRVNIPGFLGLASIPYDAQAYSNGYSGCKSFSNNLYHLKDVLYNYASLIKVNYANDLFPVKSSFNGCAIYKTKALNNVDYTNNGDISCEHCYLHKNISNLYVAPGWVTYLNFAPLGDGGLINQFKNIMSK